MKETKSHKPEPNQPLERFDGLFFEELGTENPEQQRGPGLIDDSRGLAEDDVAKLSEDVLDQNDKSKK